MTFLQITETMSVLKHMNDEGGLQLPFVKKILKLNTRKSQSNASVFVKLVKCWKYLFYQKKLLPAWLPVAC